MAVVVQGTRERGAWCGDDEAARAEAQVHELEHARARFREHVLPDDPKIGRAALHVRRDIRRARAHDLDLARTHDEAALSARDGGDVDARRGEPRERVLEQRTLRDSDA